LKKEEEAYLKQRQILEQKAAAYEKLSRGEKMVREDGTAAEFLVKFLQLLEIIFVGVDSWPALFYMFVSFFQAPALPRH
jgi:hypothetical protein